jgi:hypothetical protein
MQQLQTQMRNLNRTWSHTTTRLNLSAAKKRQQGMANTIRALERELVVAKQCCDEAKRRMGFFKRVTAKLTPKRRRQTYL